MNPDRRHESKDFRTAPLAWIHKPELLGLRRLSSSLSFSVATLWPVSLSPHSPHQTLLCFGLCQFVSVFPPPSPLGPLGPLGPLILWVLWSSGSSSPLVLWSSGSSESSGPLVLWSSGAGPSATQGHLPGSSTCPGRVARVAPCAPLTTAAPPTTSPRMLSPPVRGSPGTETLSSPNRQELHRPQPPPAGPGGGPASSPLAVHHEEGPDRQALPPAPSLLGPSRETLQATGLLLETGLCALLITCHGLANVIFRSHGRD